MVEGLDARGGNGSRSENTLTRRTELAFKEGDHLEGLGCFFEISNTQEAQVVEFC